MQKIVPTLWLDGRVKEALDFDTSIFEDAKIEERSRYGEAG